MALRSSMESLREVDKARRACCQAITNYAPWLRIGKVFALPSFLMRFSTEVGAHESLSYRHFLCWYGVLANSSF